MTSRISCIAAAALAAATSACSTYPPAGAPIPTEPGSPPFPSLPPDAVPATSPAQVAGAWTSAGPGQQPAMQVDIDNRRITANFGCLAKAWTYRFEGQRIAVAPDTIVSCMRMETPYEAEMFNHIAAATIVYHRGGRGLIFRGSGSQLVLVPR